MNEHVKEGYGDPHLHYDAFPEHDSTHSPVCKWNADNVKFYQNYVPEEPLYPCRCHVEYCHPGTWQGTDGPKCGCANVGPMPTPMPAAMPAAPGGLLNTRTLMYAGAGILVGLLLLFLLRKKLRLRK